MGVLTTPAGLGGLLLPRRVSDNSSPSRVDEASSAASTAVSLLEPLKPPRQSSPGEQEGEGEGERRNVEKKSSPSSAYGSSISIKVGLTVSDLHSSSDVSSKLKSADTSVFLGATGVPGFDSTCGLSVELGGPSRFEPRGPCFGTHSRKGVAAEDLRFRERAASGRERLRPCTSIKW